MMLILLTAISCSTVSFFLFTVTSILPLEAIQINLQLMSYVSNKHVLFLSNNKRYRGVNFFKNYLHRLHHKRSLGKVHFILTYSR